MKTVVRLLPALVAAAGLAACAGAPSRDRPDGPPGGPARGSGAVSANGEPLTGGGTHCADRQAQWLARADASQDGRLDPAEFRADGARWFATMDLDADGQVTPQELRKVRASRGGRGPGPGGGEERDRGDGRGGGRGATGGHGDGFGGGPGDESGPLNAGPGGGRGGPAGEMGGPGRGAGGDSRQGGGHGFGASAEPDPVMAADANFDFAVSRQEYDVYTGRKFALLDVNRDGSLVVAELANLCGAPDRDQRRR